MALPIPVSIDIMILRAVHQSSYYQAILFNQMQLLACNVAVKDTTVNVSAATGKLVKEPFAQPDVGWHDWQLPQLTSDPLLSIVRISPLLGVSLFTVLLD